MRLESCRICGTDLKPDLKCNICRDFTSFHCPKCGKSNEIQTHIHSN